MAIEVVVGPPLVTINRGDTFVVSAADGCITAYTDQGIYSRDTRYVSNYEIFADGQRWVLQNSGAVAYYASRTYLTNPKIVAEYNEIQENTVSLILDRAVVDCGIHEDFDIRNYSTQRIRFSLELSLRTDFADIFEVKAKRIVRKGSVTTEWLKDTAELISSYQHDQFKRSMTTHLLRAGSVPSYNNGRISFLVDLGPGASWHTCCEHLFSWAAESSGDCVEEIRNPEGNVEQALKNWKSITTSITTSNEDVYRLFKQSVEDMAALRLPDIGQPNTFLPAAGVPWFVTVFGRDSLIVSLQNLIVYPDYARGALDILGRLQAVEMDDYRDAQPGKILHEIRIGELA